MAGIFPPGYFGPDYFGSDYFGGETDPNAMSAALAGTSSVTGTLGAASSAPTFSPITFSNVTFSARTDLAVPTFSPITFSSVTFSTRNVGVLSASLAGTSSLTAELLASTAPTFSPITFSSIVFSTRDQGAISAAINGLSEVLATISVTSAAVEDDDSGYWARVVSERRKKKLKAQKPVPGVLAARIVGRSRLVALGEAPRVCWPCNVYAGIVATSALRASIEGPDRIAEQDEQDLQDLTDILMLLAA